MTSMGIMGMCRDYTAAIPTRDDEIVHSLSKDWGKVITIAGAVVLGIVRFAFK